MFKMPLAKPLRLHWLWSLKEDKLIDFQVMKIYQKPSNDINKA